MLVFEQKVDHSTEYLQPHGDAMEPLVVVGIVIGIIFLITLLNKEALILALYRKSYQMYMNELGFATELFRLNWRWRDGELRSGPRRKPYCPITAIYRLRTGRKVEPNRAMDVADEIGMPKLLALVILDTADMEHSLVAFGSTRVTRDLEELALKRQLSREQEPDRPEV